MFEKKCRRCEGTNIRKITVNVRLKIKPYSDIKHNIKKFIAQETCWVCEECDAFILKSDAAYKRYFSECDLKSYLTAKYKKDNNMEVELLFA